MLLCKVMRMMMGLCNRARLEDEEVRKIAPEAIVRLAPAVAVGRTRMRAVEVRTQRVVKRKRVPGCPHRPNQSRNRNLSHSINSMSLVTLRRESLFLATSLDLGPHDAAGRDGGGGGDVGESNRDQLAGRNW
mmetsp:Transcript_16755/g.36405  ORF Transcript_16755/g.36405 Transcript_16755/m.36405 type:complete len:132 (-) Transcript_16755:225-620(-)